MCKYWAYILIGDDGVGKTTFQKNVILNLCNVDRSRRLDVNLIHEITRRDMPRGLKNIFTMNRSIQEKMDVYQSVDRFFDHHFSSEDICILSSHASGGSYDDVERMIYRLKHEGYNVSGVFLSNGWTGDAQRIATLPWHETLWINNPHLEHKDQIDARLADLADRFCDNLVRRAQGPFGEP